MAPFTNPLRHLWGRGQAPTTELATSLSNFDGMSDGGVYDQQIQESPSQQHLNGTPVLGNETSPLTTGHYQRNRDKGAHQAVDLRQYGQPSPQLVVHQNNFTQNNMHGSDQAMQELESGGHEYYDMTRQQPSHTATATPPCASSQLLRANDDSQAYQLSNTTNNASAGVQVKQEPTSDGVDDRTMFAEFTNEDAVSDDFQDTAIHRQVAKDSPNIAVQASCNALSIKPEPVTGGQSSAGTFQGASSAPSTVNHDAGEAPDMLNNQTHASVAIDTAQATSKTGVSISRANAKASPPQTQHPQSTTAQVNIETSEPLPTVVTDASQAGFSFERYAQDSRHLDLGPQGALSGDKSLSPSADSVIGYQRNTSEETALSLSGNDLMSNQRLLAQQWQQRHELSGMGPLAAEAVQAKPNLLHGLVPTQHQNSQNTSQVLTGIPSRQPVTNYSCGGLMTSHNQHVNVPQQSANFPYSMAMQYHTYPTGAPHDQLRPHGMPPSYGPDPLMQYARIPGYPPTQMHPPHGHINPQRSNGEMQEEERPENSDDDGPSATRMPHYHPTAASPDPYSPFNTVAASSGYESQQGTSTGIADPTQGMPRSSVPGDNQDSVIELSDDDDDDGEETGEAIPWALPKYEITYHPPDAAGNLPTAKVSIPGPVQNLVREEVMLTEDHSEQEMQLFLHVFLPAQQALQTPDPQPAHAVINFHTIAVMVLEACVQYEIGDEMGRGYGFHGGNEALRPNPATLYSEPARIRSAQDADVDDIFFAVIDRWRAGLASGKGTLKLIRGCQEFCDIALDIIHYVKEHGLLPPEAKKRKERSDKGVARGPRGGANEAGTKDKAAGKRKADAIEGKAPAKRGTKAQKTMTLEPRKKAKVADKKKPEVKGKPKPKPKSTPKPKLKPKPKPSGPGLVVIPREK